MHYYRTTLLQANNNMQLLLENGPCVTIKKITLTDKQYKMTVRNISDYKLNLP